ncbi:Segregation and condensation protein B [bioreactor metagenome]|uniref:Segregation and condensation protein B n=1 Tax=bioreactor metagenome TaxID=1076179 RepID=A0A645E0K8_9ZZZZ|nr:SMC-Scp complex subunit ScpB [Oscillospiraceae bacterium]
MSLEDSFNEQKIKFLVNAMEAVLFAGGDPVPASKLTEIFGLDLESISELAVLLRKKLASSCDTSFELCFLDGNYQLCTKQEYAGYVSDFLKIKRTAPLSKPALEALAVIAYKQPVTRSYIEKIRGVDCSGIVNTLVQRELIEEAGRLDAPGKPILYRTTSAFLRSFGLTSLSELPPIEGEIQISLNETINQ